MKRWLYLLHRWLGIGLCVLMAMWFVSGAVMLYVGYPKLSDDERRAGLPALDAARCCVPLAQALDAAGFASASSRATWRLTSIGGVPTYVLGDGARRQVAVDARSGRRIDGAGVDDALHAARHFAGPDAAVRDLGSVVEDAWTHSRALDAHRPLHRMAVDGGALAGRWLYVSSRTGEIVRDATRAAELGYQVAIHAIGDRGNAHALSALEAARAAATRAGHAFRGRVEHAQVLGPDDLARFVAGGFVASMQPTHATSDMRWAEARVGPERLRGAYAWRTFLDAKVALAFGTDAPVESYDPRLTLWAAVTRQAPDGTPPGGWIPEQAVTFDEAVLAQSAGVAYAAMGEHDRGRVVPGHTLALTLFASDPRSDMRGARVVGTVRGLRVRVPAR